MGLPVMEGYGLTETTAPMAGNRPGRIRSGTVGELVPGTAVRIDDQSHVWVRGVGVSPGYLDPDQTAASFRDGWFDTGDLGRLDEDGYLTITGRAKDVLVTAGGKTVSPQAWERSVSADPLVAHAVVVGDREPYLSSLLLLDQENTDAWALDHAAEVPGPAGQGQAVEVTNPDLVARMAALVEAANTTVARSETVKRFRVLLADLSVESGLLTPTQKLRRQAVVERFAPVIEDIYRR